VLEITTERLLSGTRIHKVKTSLRSAHGAEVTVVLSARAIEVGGQPCGIYTFIDLSELEAEQREHQETQDLLSKTMREQEGRPGLPGDLRPADPSPEPAGPRRPARRRLLARRAPRNRGRG